MGRLVLATGMRLPVRRRHARIYRKVPLQPDSLSSPRNKELIRGAGMVLGGRSLASGAQGSGLCGDITHKQERLPVCVGIRQPHVKPIRRRCKRGCR